MADETQATPTISHEEQEHLEGIIKSRILQEIKKTVDLAKEDYSAGYDRSSHYQYGKTI